MPRAARILPEVGVFLIEKDSYLLVCGKYMVALLHSAPYIELNPVRAKLVEKPEDYRWSSYRVYAYEESNALIDMNPLYETLGKTKEERQISYRDFVVEKNNILKGQFYGSDRFIADMEENTESRNSLPNEAGPVELVLLLHRAWFGLQDLYVSYDSAILISGLHCASYFFSRELLIEFRFSLLACFCAQLRSINSCNPDGLAVVILFGILLADVSDIHLKRVTIHHSRHRASYRVCHCDSPFSISCRTFRVTG